jgi:hypothetical protein
MALTYILDGNPAAPPVVIAVGVTVGKAAAVTCLVMLVRFVCGIVYCLVYHLSINVGAGVMCIEGKVMLIYF